MSLIKKISFLVKNPSFPIQFYKLKRELTRLKNIGKQRWIFQCDFAGHYPYLKPYYEYSKQYNDVEIFFTVGYTKQESPKEYLISQGIPENRILEPIDYIPRTEWDLYLSPTEWGNAFPSNKNALRVQIFHTLADKNLEYSEELLKFNTIFANGPIHHEFLDKYVFKPYPASKEKINVCNTGYAKIDDLFNNSYSKTELKKLLNINEEDKRKIILYAPNWEAGSALRTYGEEVFRQLKELDYLVLIKLHYMSFLSSDYHYATGGVDWRAVLDKYSKHENIRLIEDQNINAYLFLADLMLTDYGGASLEFMSMDKPIVYLDCPEFFNERGHHIFEKKARETGPIIDDPNVISKTIESSLSNIDPYKDKRKKLSEKLLYNPGNATKTGFKKMHELVKENKKIET